jgi:hypothetical protein
VKPQRNEEGRGGEAAPRSGAISPAGLMAGGTSGNSRAIASSHLLRLPLHGAGGRFPTLHRAKTDEAHWRGQTTGVARYYRKLEMDNCDDVVTFIGEHFANLGSWKLTLQLGASARDRTEPVPPRFRSTHELGPTGETAGTIGITPLIGGNQWIQAKRPGAGR